RNATKTRSTPKGENMELKRLGRRQSAQDSRTLLFANYLKKALPAPPPTESFIDKVPSWPMMLNDRLGDCVVAAMGHMIQQWTFFASTGSNMVVLPDSAIEKGYEDIGGYVPGLPWTDNGCDMLTALRYWRKHGLAGHKILGFAKVDPTNIAEVQQAIWMFGNLFCGVWLPVYSQNPIEPNKWTVPPTGPVGPQGAPGTWGGHCVPLMGASPYIQKLVTWGQTWKMTSNFRTAYCDE